MLNYRQDTKKKGMKKLLSILQDNFPIVVFIFLLISGFIALCIVVSNDKEDDLPKPTTITYEEAHHIYLAMSKFENLNPLTSNDLYESSLNSLLYRGLFSLDEFLGIKKDLVESYDISSPTCVDIKLSDVSFSDGKKLTASDVAFTVDTIKEIGQNTSYFTYVSRIAKIEILGDDKIRVIFYKADDASLSNLVFPIVERSSFDAKENFVRGIGFYTVTHYEQGKYIDLTPNKAFLNDTALPIRIEILQDIANVFGQISIDGVTASLVKTPKGEALAKDKGLKSFRRASNELEYIGFNCTSQAFSDKKMRKLVSYCIDTKAMINDNYAHSASSSETLYYPNYLDTKKIDSEYNFRYDLKKAKDIINELKMYDENDDGYIEDRYGRDLNLKIIVNNLYVNRVGAASTLKETLSRLGINSTIISLNQEDYNKALKSKNFDLYIGGVTLDKQMSLSDFFAEDNFVSFNDKRVIDAVKLLNYAKTPDEQKAEFIKVKKLLFENVPYVPICYKDYYVVAVPTFEAKELPNFYNFYNGVSTWTWKKRVSIVESEQDVEK